LLRYVVFGSIARVKRIPIAILAALIFTGTALAHARLMRSQPAKDARLTTTPATVELWFNELLDHGFNGIEVFAAAEKKSKHRTNLTQGDALVDAADRTHLSVSLQPLPPGQYVIEYRVLSRDGHTAPGRINFTVAAQ
jgi:methionine-rich copper-binding protein CopC